MQLGGFAIAAALQRAGVAPEDVDEVLMGQVLQAGQGQITARQAAVAAGIPMSVHATTINKVCLSGLNTIYLADLLIRAGEAEVIVAGGMESMTQAPHLLPGARAGFRLGDATLVDSMMLDGLTCAFDQCAMGLSTERHNAGRISRERQDAFSAASHEKAAAAIKNGLLAEEIVAGRGPPAQGRPARRRHRRGRATRDDRRVARRPASGVRPEGHDHGRQRVADLRRRRGRRRHVRGRARGDGACRVLGELVAYGQVAGPDASLLSQPANAIRAALAKAGLAVGDLDLVEINEAFAAVGLQSADELGLDESRLNVNGGAIALGHPVGMSGTRLALTALLELRRRGGGTAAVALCGGGGQGDAAVLRTIG